MNRELEEDFMRSRRQRYRSVTHNKSRQKSRRTWIKDMREWIITAGIVFAVMSLLNIYVFNVSTVIGQSMEPTLYQGRS